MIKRFCFYKLFSPGLNKEEFERFLKRVPTHLKEKFQNIAAVSIQFIVGFLRYKWLID